ncbi:Tetrapyrrole methylase, subdomain 1 [Ostreococcus tauri]|uniref:diphthine methyl ester synthase n=1 Tax=Ostreococcus tauri TaxID=70448 RepID=A0A096P827_OSTTA|nr:Tetrapyrrole methylase, subdomain 1 [Ostreococcus tauri]OUS44293.1 tetrapyrrole methylase [Ostreococcus tauri]CEG00359.1 Tetrapyrrole methylase, subdomain 1 [Ostreococcus tauri]|eukprot:XP_022840338.1 Tetrapyrrole methylase, subdomain 1 [Ostreococcus tauri]
MLYLIGLGLGNERDVTLRGLDAIRSCAKVYLEAYTSVLGVDASRMEALYEKPVVACDRRFVEQGVDAVLDEAKDTDVAFCVVGDAFAATTHGDLVIRAREKGVAVRAVYNASIMNAVAGTGLSLYNFGRTVSICFFTPTWRPDSFYDWVRENRKTGAHTLCLLDIRVKEPTVKALCRGIEEYEPPRFMTAATAATQMLEVEETRGEGAYSEDTMCVAVARVGQDDEKIRACTLGEMRRVDMGAPLHSLVLVGDVMDIESAMLATHEVKPEDYYEGEPPSQMLDA